MDFWSPQSCEDAVQAIQDDAGVFGRLRRLGCIVYVHFKEHFSCGEFGSDPGGDPGDG